MTSHVVVVDSTARRATIKTLPETHLAEVLQAACSKLGHDENSYVMKHKTKILDLSLTFRLSGLVSGAKLELVLSSRSPSAVSVAIQLPEPDLQGLSRLTDKLSSNTTLWMVLRHFESRADANGRNFTGRAASPPGAEGVDRLYYNMPVVNVMTREFSSIVDLQKTLAQLGFNSGSLLLRLSFKVTDIPFEEATQQISQYLSSSSNTAATSESSSKDERKDSMPPDFVQPVTDASTLNPASLSPDLQHPQVAIIAQTTSESNRYTLNDGPALLADKSREITILASPTSGSPKAARETFDEAAFVPTVDHAKLHQARLSAATSNRRLLSDAEVAVQAEARSRQLENVHGVTIKLRFPDQMQSICKFTKDDTADDLYAFVKALLTFEEEPFHLRYNSTGGMEVLPRGDQGELKLIKDLQLTGNILVNVVWSEGASVQARSAPALKTQFREKAKEIEVPQLAEEVKGASAPEPESKASPGKGNKGRIPKWMKLPGKK